MGFLSGIRDAYRGLDRSVTKAEKKALEIVVPKRDRKSARELAHFLDRFAGMIATDAPNTDVAPSFVHETLAPFREVRKKQSPYNVYAAAMAPLGLFPWGTKEHAGPKEWGAKAVPGGRIVRTETEQSPTYRFIPPGSDTPIRNVYNDVTMRDASSHINMLSHTDRSVPREILHDFMAPLNNRFQEHGIPIDAMPVNVKVAASVLRSDIRPGREKKYTPYTVTAAKGLMVNQLQELTGVAENMISDPRQAASYAGSIRRQLHDNDASPSSFAKAMKLYEGWVRSPEGGNDPRFELPDYARGQGIKDLLEKIQDPDQWDTGNWESRTSGIVVPGGRTFSASVGEGVPAGSMHTRPPGRQTVAPTSAEVEAGASRWWDEQHPEMPFTDLTTFDRNNVRTHWASRVWPTLPRDPFAGENRSTPISGSHLESALHEAERQHQPWEWDAMADNDRHAAAARASNGFPANVLEMDALRRDAEEWWNRRNAGDPFSSYGSDDRNAIIRQYQNEGFSSGLQPPPRHPFGSVDRATEAIMGAIENPYRAPAHRLGDPTDEMDAILAGENTRPSLTEITRHQQEAGDRLQSSFESFVLSRERAAEEAHRRVGEAEWRRMTPEARDSLIRAQMAQGRREMERSDVSLTQEQGSLPMMRALAERAREMERGGLPLDLTERATLQASRDPDWLDWTEQERRAEARRIRRQLSHESER